MVTAEDRIKTYVQTNNSTGERIIVYGKDENEMK